MPLSTYLWQKPQEVEGGILTSEVIPVYQRFLLDIGAMWDQPLFDLYHQVRCPITLILAEHQPTNEAEELRFRMRQEGIAHIQTLRPDVRVVRMPDTIHDIPLQRPAQLAEEIVS